MNGKKLKRTLDRINADANTSDDGIVKRAQSTAKKARGAAMHFADTASGKLREALKAVQKTAQESADALTHKSPVRS